LAAPDLNSIEILEMYIDFIGLPDFFAVRIPVRRPQFLEFLMSRNPWFRAGLNVWSLGLDSSHVVALRLLKMAAGGPAAAVEARRMIDEKIEAGLAVQAMALTGGLGATPHAAAAKVINHYRRKVRANRRRLIKN
jgi:hypothetical protein